MVKVNKFSMFCWEGSETSYTAPSRFVGMKLEARVLATKVQLYWQGKCVAEHDRVIHDGHRTVIKVSHIIKPLSEKPGVAKEWEHQDVLFSHPVWLRFFKKLEKQDKESALTEHVRCLNLMTKYGEDSLTTAMELLLGEDDYVGSKKLEDLITNDSFNPLELKPVRRNLLEYDRLLQRGGNK